MKSSFFLFLLIGSLALAANAGLGENLLVNPGFEANPVGHVVPNGWSRFAPPPAAIYMPFGNYWIENTPPVAHSGIYYWKEWGACYDGTNNVAGIYQVFNTSPGSMYQADGWFYVNAGDVMGPSSFTWIEVQFLNSSSNVLALFKSQDFSASVGTGTWFDFAATNACDVTQPLPLGDPFFTNSFVVTGAVSVLTAPPGTAMVKFQYNYLQGVTGGANDGGSSYFDDATLDQLGPPTPPSITGQPESITVHAHDDTSFSVVASGTAPLSYQWSFNGANIPGAVLSSLTISNVMQTNLGAYSVLITSPYGTATSSNAVLSMYPFIVTPFAGAVTYWGSNATLSVDAWGSEPLNYQWFFNGTSIDGATNEALVLTTIQFTNAGLYTVVVSDPLGTVTNTPEEVVVEPAGVSIGFCPALTISGVTGYTYIVQSAPNLTDTNAWITRASLTLTQGIELWVDTNVDASSPFNSKYFYRVLPGP